MFFIKFLAFMVITNITVVCIKSAPSSDGNVTKAGVLNGEKLIEIGAELKLPILQMVGKTIDNVEKKIEEKVCDLHLCSDWTEWSTCKKIFGQFGSKFRTRLCNVNKTSCKIDTNSRTEKEFGICILDKTCPVGYNITSNGFCMKFLAENLVTRDAAEQQCQKDGGHLVNIDSEPKYEDVSSLLKGYSNGVFIWIDGHRQDVNSPWEYTYGSQKGFFKWNSSEPHNHVNDLCLSVSLNRNILKWFDSWCTTKRYLICEVSPSQF